MVKLNPNSFLTENEIAIKSQTLAGMVIVGFTVVHCISTSLMAKFGYSITAPKWRSVGNCRKWVFQIQTSFSAFKHLTCDNTQILGLHNLGRKKTTQMLDCCDRKMFTLNKASPFQSSV